jgi:hypothetical protein
MIFKEAANTKLIVFGLIRQGHEPTIYHDVQNDRRSHRNKRKMKKKSNKKKSITSMNQGIQIMLKSSLK